MDAIAETLLTEAIDYAEREIYRAGAAGHSYHEETAQLIRLQALRSRLRKQYAGSLAPRQCPVDWGSAMPSQCCVLNEGHPGDHCAQFAAGIDIGDLP